MTDVLCLIENDSDILAMVCTVKDEKKIFLNVDHTNFVKNLREDIIIPIPLKYRGQLAASVQAEQDESTSSAVICASPRDEDADDSERASDNATNSEFYDSDFDAEDGDNDLFRDNVDTDVNDNNETADI
jgi:hypothetical protein